MTDPIYRRPALDPLGFTPGFHAGLWLDRFLRDEGKAASGEGSAKARHVAAVRGALAPEGYAQAFERWRGSFEAHATTVEARVVDRMVVGLAAGTALETGIRLCHTWGVPIIPGSALKGIAALAAKYLVEDADWKPDGDSYKELFGTNDQAGLVHFSDAWWIPDGAAGQRAKLPLYPDVMTVHHGDYYVGPEPCDPSDRDDPVPVPFIAASGRFLIAVEAHDEEWRTAALDLLTLGLKEFGVGAKTRSGYGRLELAHTSDVTARHRGARDVQGLVAGFELKDEAQAMKTIEELGSPAQVESARRRRAELIATGIEERLLNMTRASAADDVAFVERYGDATQQGFARGRKAQLDRARLDELVAAVRAKPGDQSICDSYCPDIVNEGEESHRRALLEIFGEKVVRKRKTPWMVKLREKLGLPALEDETDGAPSMGQEIQKLKGDPGQLVAYLEPLMRDDAPISTADAKAVVGALKKRVKKAKKTSLVKRVYDWAQQKSR